MPKPLIVLNPGHCLAGGDPGACSGSLKEAEITMCLCELIAAGLPAYGIDSIIICANELSDICTQANQHDADLFLSIHVNAGKGTGYEDYTYSANGRANDLRGLLRIDVMNYLRTQEIGDRGQKTKNLAVLRGTTMPAVLTENLFIDHPKDAAKLADPAFIRGLAGAYVRGIARALGCALKPKETLVPEWAKEAVMWGIANDLITTQEGSNDFYRFMTVLYRYDMLRKG
jgi:N-acetylmuramoyl-L-alanine amidase